MSDLTKLAEAVGVMEPDQERADLPWAVLALAATFIMLILAGVM